MRRQGPSSGVDSEIIASRGAVRMPLPVRSISTIAPIADTAVPTVASRSLQSAERPYPVAATSLCLCQRSPMKPLARPTSELAPLYSPSITPKASGENPPTYTRYSGRIVTTISEEMSVKRLVSPSRKTVRATRGLVSSPARMRRRARRSEVELETWYMREPRASAVEVVDGSQREPLRNRTRCRDREHAAGSQRDIDRRLSARRTEGSSIGNVHRPPARAATLEI